MIARKHSSLCPPPTPEKVSPGIRRERNSPHLMADEAVGAGRLQGGPHIGAPTWTIAESYTLMNANNWRLQYLLDDGAIGARGLQRGRHIGAGQDGRPHVHAHLPVLQERRLYEPCNDAS